MLFRYNPKALLDKVIIKGKYRIHSVLPNGFEAGTVHQREMTLVGRQQCAYRLIVNHLRYPYDFYHRKHLVEEQPHSLNPKAVLKDGSCLNDDVVRAEEDGV